MIDPKLDFLNDRTRFGSSSRADLLSEIVQAPHFKHACQVALLEYAMQLNCEDPRAALKLHGAKAVMSILLALPTANLSPNVESEMPSLQPV